MFFGQDISQIAFVFVVAVAVGGMALAIFFPLFANAVASKRIQAVTSSTRMPARQSLRSRLMEDPKDTRRKQIQDSLNQLGERERQRKKKLNLRTLIAQTGIDLSIRTFWMFSLILGVVMAIVPFIFALPWYVSVGAGLVGFLGLPRWFIKFLRNRRQNIFLNDFADAIDVMVRGLKSGLPVTDAMKVIAAESGPPVGPEFSEVVEGQRIGISVDQGIERMVERMPLAEVNFLAIVMAIQAKTGGNLSEALSNLSKVLRDRKKMKAKIRSMSQEAKSSAAIIGSLPFIIMGALTVLNPEYLNPMFYTRIGNIMLGACAVWMTTGVLVMRKMINFEI
ncbi:MAG TPA: type II secretion system F family protein [Aestuariivirga sp.]|jgi:tight adherence protein B|nr:type II secretion system F family protein [Aestuariivirga sp.]